MRRPLSPSLVGAREAGAGPDVRDAPTTVAVRRRSSRVAAATVGSEGILEGSPTVAAARRDFEVDAMDATRSPDAPRRTVTVFHVLLAPRGRPRRVRDGGRRARCC